MNESSGRRKLQYKVIKKEKAMGKLDQDLLHIPQCRSSVHMNSYFNYKFGSQECLFCQFDGQRKMFFF